MRTRARRNLVRAGSVAVAVGTALTLGAVGHASADVRPGTYTSTTWSGGTVLLKRDAHVQGGDLVLIGRYRIHPTTSGGYVDLFPGHRVVLNRDGHGGYRGPAYFGGARIGSITLTPKR
ncbi:hypothetical protein [Gordonia humi]|uniref:Secreted protein n=1 Tax=Gordonia humi TaxID=686429 RepID=A0A840F1M5_9ACTN|nr:hypothetical protein [Gordonia humi]MBB4136373.1 hypothetical protein [Gordonia humi]